ncbi:hypothetical protein FOPG_18956 [Fusarium oxysporum f. sp. conglutinans race 2 54008]|uniref:MULE transposase domain-containing protein n=1 Tax=Fusarium oxysporum f. sp. conglutinans race 2 54008 TaxID=1089457 RepID=X0GNF0_FUSOX|nr:hypothetical protein FOPG_18956 [Fusarium oxysporum f. sp. conglutinans race 2 54008]
MDRTTISSLTNAGIAPKDIRTYIRQNSNTIATQQDIYNRIADSKRELCEGQSTIHAFANQLDKEGFWNRMQLDSYDRVTAVLFAHPESLAYLKAYPDLLFLDCTYKTNKYGMPLLDIIGADACQRSFCIAFAFLSSENEEDYTWALGRLRSIYELCGATIPPISEHSRILQWDGLSTATAYAWIGITIYLGIHREISIKDHWKSPRLGYQRPLHPITKFMPLRKFELITRYFRTFDYTKLDVHDEGDLPKTFQAAEPWSDHIQKASAELFIPGTNLTIDECMVPFKGRSKETTVVKNKPTPASPYKAVIVELPTPKPHSKKGKLQTTVALNNTQSVVIHLCNLLPKLTYHVFTDNLFSSPNLFRALQEAGCGATGTARPTAASRLS